MTTVKEAGLATIDMKLEVIVIPVLMPHARSSFTAIWAGGRTSHRQAQAYSNSPRTVPPARSNSARASLRRRPAQPRERT